VDNAVQKLFYSGKHKRHCDKYECGVRRDGLICWINGPHQGSKADVTVYREESTEDHLDLGERILGDKGYFGEKRIITPRKKKALERNLRRRSSPSMELSHHTGLKWSTPSEKSKFFELCHLLGGKP